MSLSTLLPESRFYKAGGNLSPDDRCYVNRSADHELFTAIIDRQYCYVLTSRQMGKSSLMHRTAVRLSDEGITPVIVDLTSIGTDVSKEQWYFGMLTEIGRQLSLVDEVRRYWDYNNQHSPLYRFTHALTDIVLAYTETPIVVFIDEIDSVLSLKNRFSTDEFFAAIRQCFNSRASSRAMRRLTFCLLGVSTPADLIQDVNTTPFNVGRRIELTDFTLEEACGLVAHLDDDPDCALRKLERIFYWTNGHPYLTQKLCLEISGHRGCGASEVDQICDRLFLASSARTTEDNLIFVHKHLGNRLSSTPYLSSPNAEALIGCSGRDQARDAAVPVLLMYRTVLCGGRVLNNPADPVVAHLALTGVVRAEDGRLRVRNRIYVRVFDGKWVNENLPDAELRRERVAYRRGLLTAVTALTVILAIVTFLLYGKIIAEKQAHLEQVSLMDQLVISNYQRTLDDLTLAQRAIEGGNVAHADYLISHSLIVGGSDMLNRFEWRYLYYLCHNEVRSYRGARDSVIGVSALPSDRMVEAIDSDGIIRRWDALRGKLCSLVKSQVSGAKCREAMFGPDGTFAIVSTSDDRVCMVRSDTGQTVASRMYAAPIHIALSPDGQTVAVGQNDGRVSLWDFKTGKILTWLGPSSQPVTCISIDRAYVAAAFRNGTLIVRSRGSIAEGATASRANSTVLELTGEIGISALRFTPFGTGIAVGYDTGAIETYTLTPHDRPGLADDGRDPITFKGRYSSLVRSIDFLALPNCQLMAASTQGGIIEIWDLLNHIDVASKFGHLAAINCCAFDQSSLTMFTGSDDRVVKSWDIGNDVARVRGQQTSTDASIHFANHDTDMLADVPSEGRLVCTAAGTGHVLWTMRRPIGYAVDSMELFRSDPGNPRVIDGIDVATQRTIRQISTDLAQPNNIYVSANNQALITVSKQSGHSSGPTSRGGDRSAWVDEWDVMSGRRLASMQEVGLRWCSLSPDGRLIALAMKNRQVDICSAAAPASWGMPLVGFGDPQGAIFSPDDGKVAVLWSDGIVDVYAVRDGKLLLSIPAGYHGVTKVFDITKNFETLAITSADGSLLTCDLLTGQQTLAFSLRGSVRSAAFSSDGTKLAVATSERTYVIDSNHPLDDGP